MGFFRFPRSTSGVSLLIIVAVVIALVVLAALVR